MGHGTHDARFRAEAELHEGKQDPGDETGVGPDEVEVPGPSGAGEGAASAHGMDQVGPDEVDPDHGERERNA